MARSRALIPPLFDPIVFDGLHEEDAAALRARAALEGLSFSNVTVDAFDLEHASVTICSLDGVRAAEGGMRYAELREVRISNLDVPVLRGMRGRWRDVEVHGSRLGSAELYDATWDAVHFVGCRLGFLNLRGSTLRDVAFTDCTIDELDVGQAKITRFAADGSRIGRLVVEQATLLHVDLRGASLDGLAGVSSLRGATISSFQLGQLAPFLAAEQGITVDD